MVREGSMSLRRGLVIAVVLSIVVIAGWLYISSREPPDVPVSEGATRVIDDIAGTKLSVPLIFAPSIPSVNLADLKTVQNEHTAGFLLLRIQVHAEASARDLATYYRSVLAEYGDVRISEGPPVAPLSSSSVTLTCSSEDGRGRVWISQADSASEAKSGTETDAGADLILESAVETAARKPYLAAMQQVNERQSGETLVIQTAGRAQMNIPLVAYPGYDVQQVLCDSDQTRGHTVLFIGLEMVTDDSYTEAMNRYSANFEELDSAEVTQYERNVAIGDDTWRSARINAWYRTRSGHNAVHIHSPPQRLGADGGAGGPRLTLVRTGTSVRLPDGPDG